MLSRFLPKQSVISYGTKFMRFSSSVPVYEKPYNAARYEVPSEGLKLSTGYAFLDVEPMPRARIMKLGYMILDEVKRAPADSTIRLWYEEKAKWVMETVDEMENIRELEVKLGKLPPRSSDECTNLARRRDHRGLHPGIPWRVFGVAEIHRR